MKDVIILANWKMNKTLDEAQAYVRDLLQSFGKLRNLMIVIFVPFPYVGYLASQCRGTSVSIGAENMFHEEWGKYIGEVSAPILASVGCSHVMLGHSIRRELFGENDEKVNLKVMMALKYGIVPVVIIGEMIEEKNGGCMDEARETGTELSQGYIKR